VVAEDKSAGVVNLIRTRKAVREAGVMGNVVAVDGGWSRPVIGILAMALFIEAGRYKGCFFNPSHVHL